MNAKTQGRGEFPLFRSRDTPDRQLAEQAFSHETSPARTWIKRFPKNAIEDLQSGSEFRKLNSPKEPKLAEIEFSSRVPASLRPGVELHARSDSLLVDVIFYHARSLDSGMNARSRGRGEFPLFRSRDTPDRQLAEQAFSHETSPARTWIKRFPKNAIEDLQSGSEFRKSNSLKEPKLAEIEFSSRVPASLRPGVELHARSDSLLVDVIFYHARSLDSGMNAKTQGREDAGNSPCFEVAMP